MTGASEFPDGVQGAGAQVVGDHRTLGEAPAGRPQPPSVGSSCEVELLYLSQFPKGKMKEDDFPAKQLDTV